MCKFTKPRETLKNEWAKMISEGRTPIIENTVREGFIHVNFWLSDYGVCFDWQMSDMAGFDFGEVVPYFDGAIKKRGESYVISFAEVDRMSYRLDNVLTLIWENINDGILSAYGLHENS